VRRDSTQQVSLLLTEFQTRTGGTIRDAVLAEFSTGRGPAWDRQACQATRADDRIVATLAGCVVCCDLSGRVLWIRRQPWSPLPSSAYANAAYWRQRHVPPLVRDGRALVSQPGVGEVQCLDVETGRLLWSAAAESPTVAGCIGTRLIVETAAGFEAMDIESGKSLWRHAAAPWVEGCLCDRRNGILCLRRATPGRAADEAATVVSLDPETGHTRGESPLRLPRQGESSLGPLVTRGDRLWVFVGGGNPAVREILELK
jgi:outer membrane protein assembly factor BamB